MRYIMLAAWSVTLGCASVDLDSRTGVPRVDETEATPEPQARWSTKAAQATREGETSLIHVGGLCSRSFTQGKRANSFTPLGSFAGIRSVDAAVDQTQSMATATAQLSEVLDRHCTGDDWCHIYTYSNGGATVSRTLALFPADRWNILWVMTAASNEGGSELSSSTLADVGDILGVNCDLSNNVGPSDHRAGWNHNDTAGNTFYMFAGYKEWWYTGRLPDFFGGGANDGVVPYHSAGGLRQAFHIPDDEPWLCYEANAHYDNHEITFSCEGFDLDHNGIMRRGIDELERG